MNPIKDETPGLVEREIERRLQRAEEVANEARRLGAWAGDAHRGEAAQQRGDAVARNILLVWKRDLTWAANTIESLHKERDELKRLLEKSVQCHDYLIDCIAAQGGDGSSCPNNEEARSTIQGTGD